MAYNDFIISGREKDEVEVLNFFHLSPKFLAVISQKVMSIFLDEA